MRTIFLIVLSLVLELNIQTFTAAQPAALPSVQQTGEQAMDGRRVLRFEHDCLPQWGYTTPAREYFYIVEPRTRRKGPLMVCFHSAGGTGESELAGNVKRVAEAGDEFTGLILNSGDGADWWWGWNEIEAHQGQYRQTLTPVENRILDTIEWTVRNYDIDRDRIYARGISMGGSGTLGFGMCRGDIFAALWAGVPARSAHAVYRLTNSDVLARNAGSKDDIPPVLVFFSQKDNWSKGMEDWLELARRNKLLVVGAWGPWGHINHYEMTGAAAFEFPWLSIRRDQAYPAFNNTSSDDKYPGFQSNGPDQSGQMNAFFRWSVLDDRATRFSILLRLVRPDELHGPAAMPDAVVTDVTLRRLQRFKVDPGRSYRWVLEQGGAVVSRGVVAPESGLISIGKVRMTAQPIVLRVFPRTSPGTGIPASRAEE